MTSAYGGDRLVFMYFIFTTLLLENKGSDTAKGFAGFHIPLRTRDFFLLGGELLKPYFFFFLIILYHECLEGAVFHFIGISFPRFYSPL